MAFAACYGVNLAPLLGGGEPSAGGTGWGSPLWRTELSGQTVCPSGKLTAAGGASRLFGCVQMGAGMGWRAEAAAETNWRFPHLKGRDLPLRDGTGWTAKSREMPETGGVKRFSWYSTFRGDVRPTPGGRRAVPGNAFYGPSRTSSTSGETDPKIHAGEPSAWQLTTNTKLIFRS